MRLNHNIWYLKEQRQILILQKILTKVRGMHLTFAVVQNKGDAQEPQ